MWTSVVSLARAAGVIGGALEDPLADRQGVVGVGRHQHDVDDPLLDDRPDLLAVLFQGLEPDLARVGLGRLPGRADAEGHVGVLGVGEDELAAADGSAWIAASFRSSDLTTSAPLPRDRHPRLARRRRSRRPSPSSPGRPTPLPAGFGAAASATIGPLGGVRGSTSGPGRSSPGGPAPSAARPRLPSARARSRVEPRRPTGPGPSGPRCRRRASRRSRSPARRPAGSACCRGRWRGRRRGSPGRRRTPPPP